MSNQQRPTAVTILVALDVALGILILLTQAIAMITRGIPFGIFMETRFAISRIVSGLVSVIIAAIDFILAYGIWGAKKWAWYSSLAFSAFGIIFAVVALFLRPRAGQVLSLFVDLIIVYILMQPRVQNYFTKALAPLASGGMASTNPSVPQAP